MCTETTLRRRAYKAMLVGRPICDDCSRRWRHRTEKEGATFFEGSCERDAKISAYRRAYELLQLVMMCTQGTDNYDSSVTR